jgi:hypothetical protein
LDPGHAHLVLDVKVAHTDDPVSCAEMVTLLNSQKFVEFTAHLRGLMAIYDNFQSDKKVAAMIRQTLNG